MLKTLKDSKVKPLHLVNLNEGNPILLKFTWLYQNTNIFFISPFPRPIPSGKFPIKICICTTYLEVSITITTTYVVEEGAGGERGVLLTITPHLEDMDRYLYFPGHSGNMQCA